MSTGPESTGESYPGSERKITLGRRAAVIILAVGIAFSSAMVIVLSPEYSPLASIHDADGDGVADSKDSFPDDPSEWNDADDDGVGDNSDEFPDDPEEWNDTDGDGTGDNSDAFPEDETEWTDSDGDGYGDNSDALPNNSEEWLDSDGDGFGDNCDEFPEDPEEWIDSDGDGSGDNNDAFPDDPEEWADTDGDGYGDNSDAFPEDESRNTPTVEFDRREMLTGFEFRCTYTELPVAWDEITFSLSDGISTILWTSASTEILSDHPYVCQDLGTIDIAGINVTLEIMEVLGNGILDVEDFFIILDEDGFDASVEFALKVLYEPTIGVMESQTFIMAQIETPTASMTKVAVTSGFRFTFLSITPEIEWSDIIVLIDDGDNSVQWAPSTSDLDGGTTVRHAFPAVTLGALTVYCNVTDLAGNGYVNQGDFFTITTPSTETFDTTTTYTVTVMYEPFWIEICHMNFSG